MKIYQPNPKKNPKEWIIDYTHLAKRNRVKVIGTKQMAKEAADLIKAKNVKERQKRRLGIDLEPPNPKKKIRFKEYSKSYQEQYTRNKRSRKNEEFVLGQLESFFGEKFLDEITPGDVNRFKQAGIKRGLKNATVNRQLIVLQAMMNIAIDSEDYGIFRNPVKKARKLKEDSHRERIMTPDEINRLMIAAASNPWGGQLLLFLIIALNTGMRKMEILSMKWSYVDFEGRTLTVTKERSKSKKERQVPINDVVVEALQNIDRESEFIFYNTKTKTHIKHLRTTFKRACRVAKIKDLRIHDLRHTAASFLVNDCGISIAVASKILGHSKIEMTMKYVHSTPEHEQLGVERLGKIFNKSRQKVDTTPRTVNIKMPLSPHIEAH